MIVFKDRQDVDKTERGLLKPLMVHFDWHSSNRCYPRVHLFPWESDLLVVTEAGYATEVEVKVSYADWAGDAKKDKWEPSVHTYRHNGAYGKHDIHEVRGWKYIKKFYYAVPQSIADKVPKNLPEYAGILAVRPKGQVIVVRSAEARKAEKLTAEMKDRLHGSMYYRFVREFMRS